MALDRSIPYELMIKHTKINRSVVTYWFIYKASACVRPNQIVVLLCQRIQLTNLMRSSVRLDLPSTQTVIIVYFLNQNN